MAKRFDYRVCQVQGQRVTFVNDEWQGRIPISDMDGENESEVLASCTHEWEYLNTAGAEGWELVTAVGSKTGETHFYRLYLRRQVG